MPQPSPIYLLKLILLPLIVCFVARSACTEITLFGDAQCKQSEKNITGPNGYPDGSCTLFSQWAPSSFLSFQVIGLDQACNVAIYGSDINTFICSSKIVEISEVNRCYNTSWMYYSIDGCITPGETPSAETSGSQSSPMGAIVGGVIGGVVALAAVIGAFLYARRSRKLQREHREHNAQLRQDLYELASKRQAAELLERRSPVEMEADVGFATVAKKSPISLSGEGNEDMVVPDKATPNKATPNKATPDKATTDQATADKAVADKAVADKAVADENPEMRG